MPKHKFKVVLPPEVSYEIEADSPEAAKAEAEQRWFKDGRYRVRPACPLRYSTETVPVIGRENELVRQLDGLLQSRHHLGMKERCSASRLKVLRKVQEKMLEYQELLLEMQTVLKSRRMLLEDEVQMVAAHQSK